GRNPEERIAYPDEAYLAREPKVRLNTEFIKGSLQRFEEKHSLIAEKYFMSGIGTRLQRIDADIAHEVIRIMVTKEFLPVLPIHDSFLVRLQDQETLEKALTEAGRHVIRKNFGFELAPRFKNIPGQYEVLSGNREGFVTRNLEELFAHENLDNNRRLNNWYDCQSHLKLAKFPPAAEA
ncbi:MAG: hypothetical protein D4S02_11335, partial [Rhodocyclaceae bacterium]